MIKILLINRQFPPAISGGSTLSFYLAKELARKQNVQVHVLTSPCDQKESKINHLNFNIDVHEAEFGDLNCLLHKDAIANGLELCKKIKPDIIHAHHIAASLVGLRLKTSFEIPIIVTLHKTPYIPFVRTVFEGDPIYSCIKFLNKTRLINFFVAGSKTFQKELIDIGVKRNKIKLIYNGIPIDWYREISNDSKRKNKLKEKYHIKDNAKIVLCPSRFDYERKELDVFVTACGKLYHKTKDTDLLFILTGKPNSHEEKQYKGRLLKIASEYRIKKRLKFLTFEDDELPVLYNISKVCVLPSSAEGLGMVLLESLAAGTPIIGTQSVGIVEVIDTDGIHGLLYKSKKSEELAQHLVSLFSDKNLMETITDGGTKILHEKFSGTMMADKHLELYKKVINGQ